MPNIIKYIKYKIAHFDLNDCKWYMTFESNIYFMPKIILIK